ncbi:MAG: hypothetical protein ACYDB2_08145 [Acidimicrobiales bacterium]
MKRSTADWLIGALDDRNGTPEEHRRGSAQHRRESLDDDSTRPAVPLPSKREVRNVGSIESCA